jgi:hypothetical protein
MSIDRLMGSVDLIWLQSVLCLGGAGLALVVMQMTTHLDDAIGEDPDWLIYVRRTSSFLLVVGFLWSWSYCLSLAWQPWPPDVALFAAFDLMLGIRIVTIRSRMRIADRRGQRAPGVVAR